MFSAIFAAANGPLIGSLKDFCTFGIEGAEVISHFVTLVKVDGSPQSHITTSVSPHSEAWWEDDPGEGEDGSVG